MVSRIAIGDGYRRPEAVGMEQQDCILASELIIQTVERTICVIAFRFPTV
jgi:hypothetical protein